MKGLGRTAVFLLAGLALFSLVFSLLAERGLWPGLPAGTLHNSDLWAGFAGGVVFLLLLLRDGKHRTGGQGDGGTGRSVKVEDFGGNPSIGIAPSLTPPVSPSEPQDDSGSDIPKCAKRYSG